MDNNEEIEVLEESSNKLKKRSSFGLIVIVILTIALAVACGWLANSYFTKSNSDLKSNANKRDEWKSLGTDISKIKDVYDKISRFIYKTERPNGGLSFSNDEYGNDEITSFLSSCVSISDLEDVSEMMYYGTKGFLKYEKASSILKKYFGENFIIDKNYNSGAPNINGVAYFDKDKNAYVVNFGPTDNITGGPVPKQVLRKITNVLEKDDEIKVIEKSIYVELEYMPINKSEYYKIYANPAKSIRIGTINDSIENIGKYTISVDDYLKDASTITSYYHKAEDGSYYFVRSEISN